MVNFGPLMAEIGLVVWGIPANFSGFRVLAALLHATLLCDIADKTAHVCTISRRPGRPTPWFKDECRAERHCCRRLERRYRRTQRAEDRRRWVDAARRRLCLNRAKYEEYWLGRLNECGRSSSLLWRSLSPLLGRDHDVSGSTDHIADSFAEFFDNKVRDVGLATAGLPPPPTSRTASSLLESFRPCTQTEVHRIIM